MYPAPPQFPPLAPPAAGVPPLAVAAAVLGFVDVPPVLLLAGVFWSVAEPDDPASLRLWTVIPLAVAVALVAGGVRLLRRKGWVLLVAATVPVIAAGLCQVVALGAGGSLPADPLLLALVVVPMTALSFTVSPGVRAWVRAKPVVSGGHSQ